MANFESFSDRLERWKSRFVSDFRKRWWWVIVGPLVGFIWALIMDRVIGATNRYLDAHALLWIKPVVASIWGSPLIHPVVVGFILFLLAVFGLVIHAYVESRDLPTSEPLQGATIGRQPDDPISRAIKLRDHTITLATELTTLLYRHGYPLEGTTDPDDSFESIPTDEGLRGEMALRHKKEMQWLTSEYSQFGMLNEHVTGALIPKRLGELLELDACSAYDVRLVMKGLESASAKLEERCIPPAQHSQRRLHRETVQSLPINDRDPCIIPRYAKSSSAAAGINNSDWFVLDNEGAVEAYDVTIDEFQVGDTILRFGKAALIHSKKYAMASPELFDIHCGKVPNYGIAIAFNGGWSMWCRETKPKPPMGAKFSQSSRITYRDRANNSFYTDFTMIYDVRKDFIDIDNIKHSRLPSAHTSADTSTMAPRIYVDEISVGLSFLVDHTYLFLSCRIVSPKKTTGIIRMKPTVLFGTGESFPCVLLEDFSDWILGPVWGDDIEMESLSLWKKLKQQPLVVEVPQDGWLGIVVPRLFTKQELEQISRIDFSIRDGGDIEHLVSLHSPWPALNKDRQVIAKHVRNPRQLL